MRRWLALLACCTLARAQSEVTLDGRHLNFSATSVSRHFDRALGELRGPISQEGTVWLGVGPALYAFSRDGALIERLDFGGPISGLDASSGQLLTVTAGFPGAQDTYTLSGGRLSERVVLPPLPEVTGWLERAAAAVPDSELKSADPSNPYLALRRLDMARRDADEVAARRERSRLLSLNAPFPALFRLAALLEERADPEGADTLLRRAEQDYAARGYDPALPLNREALRAYGDPVAEAQHLLETGQLARAQVWLETLRRAMPRAQGAGAAFERYAALLRARGLSAQAAPWEAAARRLREGTLYHLGPQSLVQVRDAARLLLLSALLSLLTAYAALLLRARPSQRRDGALGLKAWARPLWRLRRGALGYAGSGEKLVFAAWLLCALLALSAWTWAARTQTALESPALNMGTYGGAWFYDQLQRPARINLDAQLLYGLAAQLDDDDVQARRYYRAAEEAGQPSSAAACIQNNLGVLLQQQGDPALAREAWRAALAQSPELSAALYNLQGDQGSEFQQRYRPLQPALCYPDQRNMVSALGGSLLRQLDWLWQRPIAALNATPTGLPAWAQWTWIAALLAACAYVALLLPLPPLPQQLRSLGGLPRSALFRALALLFPGVALLEGVWGGLLLLLWSALLIAGLSRLGLNLGGLTLPWGLIVAGLALGYLINLFALWLGQRRYWRALRREQD